MSLRPQLTLATVIVSMISGSSWAGWYTSGWGVAVGCAMTAFWLLATIVAIFGARRGRRDLERRVAVLVSATRKSELQLLTLHLVEVALVIAPSLFFLLGDTLFETIVGVVVMAPAFLKVFVLVRSYSTLSTH